MREFLGFRFLFQYNGSFFYDGVMRMSLFNKKYLLRNTLSLIVSLACFPINLYSQSPKAVSIHERLAALEATSGGHLGVSAINTANNERILYRANADFSLQSTVKVLVVSAILKQSMADPALLQQKITYTKKDLVEWAPITAKHIADGMRVVDLCEAAIRYSDGTAMDLLVKKLGGPEAVVVFARSIHDRTFKYYPLKNSSEHVITDTPLAMQNDLQQLVLGDILGEKQREQLKGWLIKNTTGDLRIRAGVPKGWIVGDKTGSGSSYGITNDIAVIWPPKSSPMVIAIYFSTKDKKDASHHVDVIAAATRILIGEFATSSSKN